jgi:VWFA-related protein
MSDRHRKSVPRSLAVLSIIALTFFVAGTARQSPQQPPLKYEVSVTLKLVQVYVTDKDGKPVRDLTKDEFKLTDNGKPVTISAFERHDLAAAPTTGVEAPAPEPALAPEPAGAPELNRKFVILFDFAFNTGHGIVAGVKAARNFLDAEVRPQDELAFVSVSMLKGVKVHEFLTTDHAKIKAALDKVTSKDIAGRADDIEQAYWMIADTSGETRAISREEEARIRSMDLERRNSMRQTENYFKDLTRFAQALRLVQGQKSVLFFSTGVPSSLINATRSAGTDQGLSSTGSAVFKSTGTVFQVGDSTLLPLQETMLREFSASSCSFYAFDTRESSKLPALFAYDEMAFLNRPSSGLLGADTGGIFRDDKTTGMDSLRRLSKQTGGKYYSNIILHEKNMDEVSAVTGTYYVLAYSIPAAADGEFHKIGIEVARKGCQVRTQPGYFNPKPYREYTDLEKNIQLFDLALNERSEFQTPKSLPVSALTYDSGQGARVLALARIPQGIWGQLGGQTAEIVALFFDAQDNLMSLQRVALTRADYAGKELLFTAGTAAKPGAVKCRVVLRDLDTGQSAVASATVYSGPSNRQVLAVFSPLLLVEGGSLFHIEGVVKGAAESPAWRDLYPYDTKGFSPVVGQEAIRTGKVFVVLPYSAPGLGAADLTFKANLVNSDTGQNVAVPLELRESVTRETVRAQSLEIALAGVPEGTYILFIHVGNKLTGQVVSARVALKVGGSG